MQQLGLPRASGSCAARQHAGRVSALQPARRVAARRVVAPRTRSVTVSVAAPREAKPANDPLGLDYNSLLSSETTCPHGCVDAIMRGIPSHGESVLSATPGETLQAIIPRLKKVTGLPVVGATGKVVGVISRKDIIQLRQSGGSLQEKVKSHMTAPAITITADTPVKDAGALMLKQKIRRLPVVDGEGRPLGIVSRSDIFAPLMKESYQEYQNKEVEAVVSGAGITMNWDIKYLYDGECSMCLTLKGVLERNDRDARIRFVDISDIDYDPMANMGVEFEDAMQTIHAIRPGGAVLQGTDALHELFGTVGLGWVVSVMESPLVSKLVEWLYEFLSKNRIKISGAMDALIAAKRVSMAKAGVEVCGDVDGGCEIEWSTLDEGDDAVSHV
ncbi:thiol-disulfide oxidoreductase [Raphidocelis subcapitata]|uniref:Thiol-disulfide oxidoreductase n=1 Tax=Raphidocelis subcapitata TaxID=307507 RepID=A0A2V0PMI0_9CHLO|nr:thiol-disulfide oxidoreductase [Raphidocelis subcapitata]|eukprot:GBG00293.1 thiol-disulfide oxidoreductase [Raphidocelis subcapitata]